MRIAVLADTHNKLPADLPERFRDANEIWHLGDVCDPATLAPLEALGKTLRVVRGNCDEAGLWPLTLKLEVGGFRILLIHIPPSSAPAGFDLILHGHTHVPRNERSGKCTFLNPGCITRPNRGAPPGFAWLELHDGEPFRWELIRLR